MGSIRCLSIEAEWILCGWAARSSMDRPWQAAWEAAHWNLGVPLQETPGCRCGGPWSDFQHLLNFTLAHAPDSAGVLAARSPVSLSLCQTVAQPLVHSVTKNLYQSAHRWMESTALGDTDWMDFGEHWCPAGLMSALSVCAAAHAHVARAGAEDEAEPEKNIDWGTALGYWCDFSAMMLQELFAEHGADEAVQISISSEQGVEMKPQEVTGDVEMEPHCRAFPELQETAEPLRVNLLHAFHIVHIEPFPCLSLPMATVVREARAALDSPQLLRRFCSGSAPRRVQLEPLEAETSPRRGGKGPRGWGPLAALKTAHVVLSLRTPDSKPPEREIQHLERDDAEAAAVLEDLDAFRQSLEEQDMVLTGCRAQPDFWSVLQMLPADHRLQELSDFFFS
eukprot:s2417_g4.t2